MTLAAHAVWMWVGQFHSQDGPAHMFASSATRRLLIGDAGALARVYTVNLDPDPNWLTYPLLSTLLRSNPPRVAELLLVTLLVIGMASALYFAVTARGHAMGPVAVAGLVVAVGWSLHTGLYNFSASVALLLAIVGYVLRIGGRLNRWNTFAVALLLVVLYFSHPLSLTVAYLVLGVIGLTTALADARERRSWRILRVRVAALVGAAIPSLVLLLGFLADPGTVTPLAKPRELSDALVSVALFRWPTQAATPAEAGWSTALAAATWTVVAVLLVTRIARRDWSRWDTLLALPLITGAGAVVLPDRMVGGTLVQPRLAIYALVTLLLWLSVANADVPLARWLGIGLGAVGVVVLCALLALRVAPYREIQVAVDEVLSVSDDIAPDRLVLGAVSSRAPHMSPVVPMVHITDLVAVEAGAVPVSTLDAGSGYGSITYRERFSPQSALWSFPRSRTHGRDVTPTQFRNLARQYAHVTGEPLDYILLVAYNVRPADLEEYADLGFRLVRRTRPTGLVHLFEVTPRVMPPSGTESHEVPAAMHTSRIGRQL